MTNKPLTEIDIRRMFGPVDDHKVLEIMGLNPSSNDLEVAMAYLADMTDIMGENRLPLSGCPARIYEIVIRDETVEIEEAEAL